MQTHSHIKSRHLGIAKSQTNYGRISAYPAPWGYIYIHIHTVQLYSVYNTQISCSVFTTPSTAVYCCTTLRDQLFSVYNTQYCCILMYNLISAVQCLQHPVLLYIAVYHPVQLYILHCTSPRTALHLEHLEHPTPSTAVRSVKYQLQLHSTVQHPEQLQRWKKMAAAAAPPVLIFHSCANWWLFHAFHKRFLSFFCAILGIFANFARFWALFAHILCANLSDSKF